MIKTEFLMALAHVIKWMKYRVLNYLPENRLSFYLLLQTLMVCQHKELNDSPSCAN